jgi:hypothetical protein
MISLLLNSLFSDGIEPDKLRRIAKRSQHFLEVSAMRLTKSAERKVL